MTNKSWRPYGNLHDLPALFDKVIAIIFAEFPSPYCIKPVFDISTAITLNLATMRNNENKKEYLFTMIVLMQLRRYASTYLYGNNNGSFRDTENHVDNACKLLKLGNTSLQHPEPLYVAYDPQQVTNSQQTPPGNFFIGVFCRVMGSYFITCIMEENKTTPNPKRWLHNLLKILPDLQRQGIDLPGNALPESSKRAAKIIRVVNIILTNFDLYSPLCIQICNAKRHSLELSGLNQRFNFINEVGIEGSLSLQAWQDAFDFATLSPYTTELAHPKGLYLFLFAMNLIFHNSRDILPCLPEGSVNYKIIANLAKEFRHAASTVLQEKKAVPYPVCFFPAESSPDMRYRNPTEADPINSYVHLAHPQAGWI